MTLTATYSDDLSRVRLSFTGAPEGADSAQIERSTNGITWTAVRGGQNIPIVSGSGAVDDYEFVPGVENIYRVSYGDADPITYVGKGSVETGNNASLTPSLPSGLAVGDLMLLAVSIRNTDAYPNEIEGWTVVNDGGNVGLYARRYQAGDTAPTVTFTGGSDGDDTLANIAAWRNASEVPHAKTSQLNASAQNMNTPAVAVTVDNTLSVFIGWKQDAWDNVTDVLSEITEIVNVSGDGAAMVWNYYIQTDATNWNTGQYTVNGGAPAISRVLSTVFPPAPWISQETATITPEIDKIWFIRPDAPYLNTKIEDPVGLLSIERKARASTFDVIGKREPLAITDVRSSKSYTIGVHITNDNEAARIDLLLDAGAPVLMHYPPKIRLKDAFVLIGDSTYDDETSTYTLPMTEVAGPDLSIVGATVLWSNVVSTWATWKDLMEDEESWESLQERIGDPTDIIVG